MKSPRFHAQKADGLYQPIPFIFVTERMCREILDELRRRAGDQLRPKEELEYIDRLLKTY